MSRGITYQEYLETLGTIIKKAIEETRYEEYDIMCRLNKPKSVDG